MFNSLPIVVNTRITLFGCNSQDNPTRFRNCDAWILGRDTSSMQARPHLKMSVPPQTSSFHEPSFEPPRRRLTFAAYTDTLLPTHACTPPLRPHHPPEPVHNPSALHCTSILLIQLLRITVPLQFRRRIKDKLLHRSKANSAQGLGDCIGVRQVSGLTVREVRVGGGAQESVL